VEIPNKKTTAYDGCAVLKYYDPRNASVLLDVPADFHYDPSLEANYAYIYGTMKTENAVVWVYNFDCGLIPNALFGPSAPLLYTATCNSTIAVPPQCQGQNNTDTYVFPPLPELVVPQSHCSVGFGGKCNSSSARDCCNSELGLIKNCSSESSTCGWACPLDTPCLRRGADPWSCRGMFINPNEAGSDGRYFCSTTQEDWEVRCVNDKVCVGEWEYCTCPAERPCLKQHNWGTFGTATTKHTYTYEKSCVALNSSTGSCNAQWMSNSQDGTYEQFNYMDCTRFLKP